MVQRSLTVVQVLPALDGGGVERGTLEVARALVARGHRSIVISAGGRLVNQLCAEGSEHLQWPIGAKNPWILRWIWPLRRYLVREQVDIVHGRSRLPAWILWLALRGINTERRPWFVTTVHGLYSVSRYSAIMTQGDVVIAVSDTVRRYIRQHYPQVDRARLRTIYRGVDPEEFPYGFRPSNDWLGRWRKKFPQLTGCQVLTLPGRLTRLKGHEVFLQLIASLVHVGLPVHGLVVGDVDPRRRAYAQELQEKVRALNVDSHITFTGHRSDVREIYAISDVVLSLSSQPESFGRTVLEALSMGVPVVGYAHGGVGEVLGRVFPRGAVPLGDSAALQRRVTELLLSRPDVTVPPFKAYRLDSMLQETLALYEELAP